MGSGKWSWIKQDTIDQITNIVIYGLAVGGVAILEKVQAVEFDNQMIGAFVGLASGYVIDALRRWSRDNAKTE